MSFEALPREGAIFALETARSAGLVVLAPMLGMDAPMKVRASLVLLLAVVAHGAAAPAPVGVEEVGNMFLAVPSELLVGLSMGFVARCALAVVEIAGDVASPMIGFGAAALFDPHTQASETGLTRMFKLLALLLGFLLGVHRVLVASLLASYRVLPPGTLVDAPKVAMPMLELTSQTIEAGLRLAVPLIAVLLMVQVALAFISRAAPAMQIFSVGFAFSLVAGTIALVVALPDMAREIVVQLSLIGRHIEGLVVALTPARGG